jgi:hypothetical protein
LLTALDHRTLVFDQAAMVEQATFQWMHVVYFSVAQVPDGRFFEDAVDRALALEARYQNQGNKEGLRDLYQSLGALHMDPYTYGRTSLLYMGQYALW